MVSLEGVPRAHVVGNALGVAGAPPCKICRLGAHYHGECRGKAWGSLGINLPSHRADGSRTVGEWNNNEPIQKTVKAWTKFLSDPPSNFNGSHPSPAGGAGAPTLVKFRPGCLRLRPSHDAARRGRGLSVGVGKARTPGGRHWPAQFCTSLITYSQQPAAGSDSSL